MAKCRVAVVVVVIGQRGLKGYVDVTQYEGIIK
jgi:hypothetical protein